MPIINEIRCDECNQKLRDDLKGCWGITEVLPDRERSGLTPEFVASRLHRGNVEVVDFYYDRAVCLSKAVLKRAQLEDRAPEPQLLEATVRTKF